MSFTTANGIMTLIEELIKFCWPNADDNIIIPFKRMKYTDAIKDYGSDKPDLRSDIKVFQSISNFLFMNSIKFE